jgi:hypothetical protein
MSAQRETESPQSFIPQSARQSQGVAEPSSGVPA